MKEEEKRDSQSRYNGYARSGVCSLSHGWGWRDVDEESKSKIRTSNGCARTRISFQHKIAYLDASGDRGKSCVWHE